MIEFTWVAFETIKTEPSKTGLYKMMKDYYWVVDSQDRIPIFGEDSEQCHNNKEIAESIVKNLFRGMDVRLVHLEKAWLPIQTRDYTLAIHKLKSGTKK